ncbi:hypothetical protein [Micromonospora deserti]|uniref:hypothetical protein n=1 Tax=Micromonospora deserti TaxID=2070366 RepID=UPI0011B7416A|nr:hypothetical protein [Micromonospora deserti]
MKQVLRRSAKARTGKHERQSVSLIGRSAPKWRREDRITTADEAEIVKDWMAGTPEGRSGSAVWRQFEQSCRSGFIAA